MRSYLNTLLGEADADELYETTIGPKADFIQLYVEDAEKTQELLYALFSNKKKQVDIRRDLTRIFMKGETKIDD